MCLNPLLDLTEILPDPAAKFNGPHLECVLLNRGIEDEKVGVT